MLSSIGLTMNVFCVCLSHPTPARTLNPNNHSSYFVKMCFHWLILFRYNFTFLIFYFFCGNKHSGWFILSFKICLMYHFTLVNSVPTTSHSTPSPPFPLCLVVCKNHGLLHLSVSSNSILCWRKYLDHLGVSLPYVTHIMSPWYVLHSFVLAFIYVLFQMCIFLCVPSKWRPNKRVEYARRHSMCHTFQSAKYIWALVEAYRLRKGCIWENHDSFRPAPH